MAMGPVKEALGGKISDQGLAGVFRIGDDVEGSLGGEPAGEKRDQLVCHLGALSVGAFRASLLGAVKTDQ